MDNTRTIWEGDGPGSNPRLTACHSAKSIGLCLDAVTICVPQEFHVKRAHRASPPVNQRTAAAVPPIAQQAMSPGRELVAIGIIVLLGFAARLVFPERIALDHFDEGVYAGNLFSPPPHYLYPARHLYAPPLLPAAIEWCFVFLGASNFVAVVPSLLAGAATVYLVWKAGREWFGPEAGLAAAALTALSDFHVVYSRAALTDVLLGFWLLLAIFLQVRAQATGRILQAVAAGVVCSLAWWTKYNGWLTLAIGLAGLVGCTVFERDSRRLFPRRLGMWAVTAVTAGLGWTPVLWGLQESGGYAAVAANHRQFFVGWSGWWGSFVQQWDNFAAMAGAVDRIGAAVAVIAIFAVRPGFTWNLRLPIVVCLYLVGGRVLLRFGGVLAVAAIVLGVYERLQRAIWDPGDESGQVVVTEQAPLGRWMVIAWIASLLVATPLYTPYPRLLIPLLIAASFAAGAGLTLIGWFTAAHTGPDEGRLRRRLGGGMVLALVLLMAVVEVTWRWTNFSDGTPAWQSRTGLKELAPRILAAAQEAAGGGAGEPRDAVFYVYGEPALWFQLRLAGAGPAVPVAHLSFAQPGAPAATIPTFLLAGPHSWASAAFREELSAVQTRLIVVQSFEYVPSDLALMDGRRPANRDLGQPQREQIVLYQLR